MNNLWIKIVALLALTLVLSGCPQPIPGDRGTAASPVLLERAQKALSQAASSISPQRERHQLAAARLLAEAGETGRAEAVLAEINGQALPLQPLAEYTLLYTALTLQNDDFFAARQLLSNRRLEQQWPSLNKPQQKQWLEQRGDLFALLGEDSKSLNAYSALSGLSTSRKVRQAVHQKIWLLLTHIPNKQLQRLADSEKDINLRGWYSLAMLARETQGDIQQQLTRISEWKRLWPSHPATLTPPSSLLTIEKIASQLPDKVALLLPLQGSLGQAGKAVRSGFMAAWYDIYQHQGDTPTVRFYDSSSSDNVVSLYQQAIAEGAEIVIGPLQKDRVRQLLVLPELAVPTIALNYVDKPTLKPPVNFFQFGLSTTDEAVQIADRAWIEGQRTALAITPKANWGERALRAFRERWLEKGGTLIEAEPYQNNQRDFAPLLKPALLIDHSEQRNRRLEQLLGKNLSHTPRRRRDLDMVFMLAYPDHARQIKPTLDFLFAKDLKVYGSSHLYAGNVDPGRNRDLEGVRFSAMPWTVPGAAANNLKPENGMQPLYRHLFAMGTDAYQLHQWLAQMSALPETRLFGNTGTLQLAPQGTITREQPWAEFRRGRVRSAQKLTEQ